MLTSARSGDRVYLDHAATTPILTSSREAWIEATEALSAEPGNPGALHFGGRAARAMLEDARERLAEALGAQRAEVIFTSGATESAALAIAGSLRAASARGEPGAWLTSALEHPAVLEQEKTAQSLGAVSLRLPTEQSGRAVVDPQTVGEVVAGYEVAVGSLTMVCSETGVVQPLPQFVAALRSASPRAMVHSDATQAVGNIPLSFAALGLDLLTLGGHKFGAPVGTGALLVGRGVNLVGDRPGGGQERGIRCGTPDVAGAVALSVAAAEACSTLTDRRRHAKSLRERLLEGLPSGVFASADFTGLGAGTDSTGFGAECVPAIVHLSLPTAHPEVLLLEMDRAGIAVSAGSACHAGVTRPSQVLLEMGRSETQALGVMRVSTGASTTAADIDRFLSALPLALEQAQRMDQYDGRGAVSGRPDAGVSSEEPEGGVRR